MKKTKIPVISKAVRNCIITATLIALGLSLTTGLPLGEAIGTVLFLNGIAVGVGFVIDGVH